MTANTIRHKRNSTPSVVPSSGQLVAGELAINTYDGKVFLRREDNAVIDIVAAQTSGVYAPLDSPSFTGIPIGPNPSISNNSNQLATTNFVQSIFSSQNTLSRSIINVTTTNYSSFNIPGGYIVGRLDLFQNGVKLLENSDFTASDGVSVTLSKIVPSGSALEYLVNYSTSSYANFSGVTSPTGNFTSSLFVNSVPVSLSGHTHTSSNITNFNSSVSGLLPTGIQNYIPKFATSGPELSNSLLYDNGINIGIGTASPSVKLHVIGDVSISGNLIFNTFTESVVTNGNSGTSRTLSLDNGTCHTITLTSNCTFTMPSSVAGKSFTLFLNTGAGNYTATFTSVKWSNNTAPVITTTANKIDIISFISDGLFWYGSYSQNY